jgi:hypothetical protein
MKIAITSINKVFIVLKDKVGIKYGFKITRSEK